MLVQLIFMRGLESSSWSRVLLILGTIDWRRLDLGLGVAYRGWCKEGSV